MDALLSFLRGLEELGVAHEIFYGSDPGFGDGYRRLTITVYASPSQHWEVEFWDDGSVQIERFVSSGGVEEADPGSLLDELRADREEPGHERS